MLVRCSVMCTMYKRFQSTATFSSAAADPGSGPGPLTPPPRYEHPQEKPSTHMLDFHRMRTWKIAEMICRTQTTLVRAFSKILCTWSTPRQTCCWKHCFAAETRTTDRADSTGGAQGLNPPNHPPSIFHKSRFSNVKLFPKGVAPFTKAGGVSRGGGPW